MNRFWMPAFFVALGSTGTAATLTIENERLAASYDDMAKAFSVTEKASGQAFLTNGKLEDAATTA